MSSKTMPAGTNIGSGGGSSAPKQPSGNGSTNKPMPAGTNVGVKGGSLNQKN